MSGQEVGDRIPGFPLRASELQAVLFEAYGSDCECKVCQIIRKAIKRMVKEALEGE